MRKSKAISRSLTARERTANRALRVEGFSQAQIDLAREMAEEIDPPPPPYSLSETIAAQLEIMRPKLENWFEANGGSDFLKRVQKYPPAMRNPFPVE